MNDLEQLGFRLADQDMYQNGRVTVETEPIGSGWQADIHVDNEPYDAVRGATELVVVGAAASIVTDLL